MLLALSTACFLSLTTVEPATAALDTYVLVDGKKAWESAVVRGGDPPIDLPGIELTGASELVLEVDPGPESFRGDRADWLELLVVR